jgi:hypothetical protein
MNRDPVLIDNNKGLVILKPMYHLELYLHLMLASFNACLLLVHGGRRLKNGLCRLENGLCRLGRLRQVLRVLQPSMGSLLSPAPAAYSLSLSLSLSVGVPGT